MPPKAGPKAPAPIDFAVAELYVGKKTWKAGTSGRLVHLNTSGNNFMGELKPKAVPRYEVALCGKAMFGRSRFAFEVQEFDSDPKSVAKLLGRQSAEMAGNSMGHFMARELAPMVSLQVKFEDIEAVEQVGDVITMKLAAPVACYKKPAGKNRAANLEVAKDITGGANTLRFKVIQLPEGAEAQRAERKPKAAFHAVREKVMAHSPRLAALFRGEAPPAAPTPTTPQKKRTIEAPASIAKRLKKEARGQTSSSQADKAAVDADIAKRQLNEHVKSLAATVDADWHDSYEETSEECQQWFEDCGELAKAVLRVGVTLGTEFGQCHEVLKQVADTWSNINAIPFRGDPGDDIAQGEGITLVDGGEDDEEEEGTVNSPDDLLGFAWPALLARAAADASVPDAALLRMIKDAFDYGVQRPDQPAPGESRLVLAPAARRSLQQGRLRIAGLFSCEADWKSLPSTRKSHRMRRGIDRRFDGPKHLRTRDFDSDDGGW